MSTATDGLGTIINGLEQGGGGGGGGGVVIEEGSANIRANREGEVTNGSFGEASSYNTLLGTGNSEGSFIDGQYNVIGGGDSNFINANKGTIGGGTFNFLNIFSSEDGDVRLDGMTIAGGSQNQVTQRYAFIGGGDDNFISSPNPGDEEAFGSAIVGGYQNVVFGNYGLVGAGRNNVIGNEGTPASYAVVVGGRGNQVTQDFSAIVGGLDHTANDHHSFIGGGNENTIGAFNLGEGSGFQFIGGGMGNSSYGFSNVIGGGSSNRIGQPIEGGDATLSFIGGGSGNSVVPNMQSGVIGGGTNNTIYDNNSFIGGGQSNLILSAVPGMGTGYQTIVGGISNASYGFGNFIGGGNANHIGDENEGQGCVNSIVAGGDTNIIGPAATSATIGGGSNNAIIASMQYATVPGGYDNSAEAQGTTLLGMRGKAITPGQITHASGQENGVRGHTQSAQFTLRGWTVGTLANESQTLQTGHDIAIVDTLLFEADKSYAFTAECVARDSTNGMTYYQTLRGLVHMASATPNLVVETVGTVLKFGSPPDGWLFSAQTLAVNGNVALQIKFETGVGNTNRTTTAASVKWVEVGPYIEA